MDPNSSTHFILFTSERFELVENKLYANENDSTLLAVVRKPADIAAGAAAGCAGTAAAQITLTALPPRLPSAAAAAYVE